MALQQPMEVVTISLHRPGDSTLDLTRKAESLRFSSTAPGGYGSCDLTASSTRISEIPHLATLRITVAGRTVWEGQVEDRGYTARGDSRFVTLTAFGRARELDEISVRRIWSRRDWAWQPIIIAAGSDLTPTTLGKRADLYQVNTGNIDPTNTSLSGVEVRGAQNSGTAAAGDCHQAFILAPDGLTLTRFMCDFDINGSNHEGIVQSSADGSSWTTHTCPTTDGTIDVALAANATMVRIGLAATAAQAITQTIYGRYTNIRILGSSLTEDGDHGFLIPTLLRDVLTLVPRMQPGRIDGAPANIVPNGYASQNINGWIDENRVTVAHRTGQNDLGNGSCQATVSSTGSSPQVGIRKTDGNRLDVTEGVVYTASCYVKMRSDYGTRNGSIRVLFYDSGGSEVAGGTQSGNTALTTSFQRIQWTFSAVPATAVTARVIVYLHDGTADSGEIYDLKLAQVVAGRSPQDWPFTVEQLDRSARTSLRSIVDEITRYDTREWYVWDDGLLDWRTVDYNAPGWIVTLLDCDDVDIPSTVDGMATTVYVTFQDPKTGLDREVSSASTDVRNPYVRQGRTRDLIVAAPRPMTQVAAQQLADNIAAFVAGFPPVRGRIVISLERIVGRATGSAQPAYVIRAGDNISIPDLPKTGDLFQQGRDSETLFHIVGTDVDTRTGRVTLEIENQQARRLDVLLARLAAAAA